MVESRAARTGCVGGYAAAPCALSSPAPGCGGVPESQDRCRPAEACAIMVEQMALVGSPSAEARSAPCAIAAAKPAAAYSMYRIQSIRFCMGS